MINSSSTSGPSVRISMRNHTSVKSFLVKSPTNSSPGPLLEEVRVDVSSDARTHKVRIGIPAKRQALDANLISAFRNIDQLVVFAGEECSNARSEF